MNDTIETLILALIDKRVNEIIELRLSKLHTLPMVPSSTFVPTATAAPPVATTAAPPVNTAVPTASAMDEPAPAYKPVPVIGQLSRGAPVKALIDCSDRSRAMKFAAMNNARAEAGEIRFPTIRDAIMWEQSTGRTAELRKRYTDRGKFPGVPPITTPKAPSVAPVAPRVSTPVVEDDEELSGPTLSGRF